MLGPLALNGAANGTRTHALLAGSAAINRSATDTCSTRDQRDIRREGLCDIGAFEFISPSSAIGTAVLTPAATTMSANQTTTLTLSWTVPPTMTWRDLHTLDFQLQAGEEQPVLIRFSQGLTATADLTDTAELGPSQELAPTETLTLFDAGEVVGTDTPGAERVLEGTHAALDLQQSRLETDGLDGKTVTLTLALRFKQPPAGNVYAATLIASNDAGELQGPEPVGTLAIGPFTTFLPLVVRS